jgi:hypothetical protein
VLNVHGASFSLCDANERNIHRRPIMTEEKNGAFIKFRHLMNDGAQMEMFPVAPSTSRI